MVRQAAEEHQRAPPLYELWAGMPWRDSWSPLVASPFWQEGSSANYADAIRESGIALYVMGGWFDELRDQGFIELLDGVLATGEPFVGKEIALRVARTPGAEPAACWACTCS